MREKILCNGGIDDRGGGKIDLFIQQPGTTNDAGMKRAVTITYEVKPGEFGDEPIFHVSQIMENSRLV